MRRTTKIFQVLFGNWIFNLLIEFWGYEKPKARKINIRWHSGTISSTLNLQIELYFLAINQSNAKETSARKFLAEPTRLCHNTQRQRYSQCNFLIVYIFMIAYCETIIIYQKFNINYSPHQFAMSWSESLCSILHILWIYSSDLTISLYSYEMWFTMKQNDFNVVK